MVAEGGRETNFSLGMWILVSSKWTWGILIIIKIKTEENGLLSLKGLGRRLIRSNIYMYKNSKE